MLGPFVNRRRERTSVHALVQRLDVKLADIDHPIRNLSGGNQQKVIIGKWIDTGAGVYLFDEPTQGVDVGAKVEIHRIIEALARDGAAVLFISSDLDETVAISDRVLVMREGELVAEFDRREATVQNVLAHCYAADAA
jgi:ABC-type sugar transport system ATPase subunit